MYNCICVYTASPLFSHAPRIALYNLPCALTTLGVYLALSSIIFIAPFALVSYLNTRVGNGHLLFHSSPHSCTSHLSDPPLPSLAMHIINIATGETSPAITPFHFFGDFNFSYFYHQITLIKRKLSSQGNFFHLINFITR